MIIRNYFKMMITLKTLIQRVFLGDRDLKQNIICNE